MDCNVEYLSIYRGTKECKMNTHTHTHTYTNSVDWSNKIYPLSDGVIVTFGHIAPSKFCSILYRNHRHSFLLKHIKSKCYRSHFVMKCPCKSMTLYSLLHTQHVVCAVYFCLTAHEGTISSKQNTVRKPYRLGPCYPGSTHKPIPLVNKAK